MLLFQDIAGFDSKVFNWLTDRALGFNNIVISFCQNFEQIQQLNYSFYWSVIIILLLVKLKTYNIGQY